MEAGKLRHYITLSTLSTTTRDEFGGFTEVFATAASVWGSIEPMSGRELESAQQVHGEATTKVTMRYTTHAAITSRIDYGSHTYEIVDIQNPEERNIELVCICKELI